MKQVITPEESGRLDAAASDRIDSLMERAGYGVALAAAAMGAGYGSTVVVLAGKGNNGGDGYVAARLLRRRGAHVIVYAHGSPKAGTAAERARRAAERTGVAVRPWTDVPHTADLVIDALFGVGFRGTLPDDILPWLTVDAPVLAVDVPSGLDAGTGAVEGQAFTADRCVTFHAYKPGHVLGEGPDRCGVVDLVDIGLSGGMAAALVCEEADAPRPPRTRTAHKWSAGSVVVVGGSPGLTGAPLLAAEAALATGAGAVTVMCPADLQAIYASLAPGIMSRGVGRGSHFTEADVDEVVSAAGRFDVMVVGPGLGLEVGEFATQVVLRRPGKLLVDADGLNNLDGLGALTARQSPCIVTPHTGEFRRMTDAHRPDLTGAAAVAELTGSVVLLKGNPTIVTGAERWVVTSGGPELATIGTGDVLAGMVAALWSRGLDAAAAARSGAYWHGRAAADLARSQTVTAADLAGFVGGYAW